MDENTANTLAKNIWELQQIIGSGDATSRARQMLLRAYSQQVAYIEESLGVQPPQRAFLLPSEESRDGVLLVHGSTGSPEDLRALGDFLHQGGFSVYGIRLPGHGLGEEDPEQTSWRACLHDVQERYRMLSDCCKRVYVVGYSFGATLAMHLDVKPPPRALILLSPAIYPRLTWLQRLLLTLHLQKLAWLNRQLGWRGQVLESMASARKTKWWYGVPMLALLARDDNRIDPRSLAFLRARTTHHRTQMHEPGEGGHGLHLGDSMDEIHRMCLEFIKIN